MRESHGKAVITAAELDLDLVDLLDFSEDGREALKPCDCGVFAACNAGECAVDFDSMLVLRCRMGFDLSEVS